MKRIVICLCMTLLSCNDPDKQQPGTSIVIEGSPEEIWAEAGKPIALTVAVRSVGGNEKPALAWSQLEGANVNFTLSNENQTLQFTPTSLTKCHEIGTYSFRLTATTSNDSKEREFKIFASAPTCFFKASESGLLNNTLNKLAMGADDALWIATPSGLNNFAKGEWRSFNQSNSPLKSNSLTQVAVAPDGKVWLGGSSGLQWFSNSSSSEDWGFNSSDLFGNTILSIAFDPNHAYVGNTAFVGITPTSKGISIFDLDGKKTSEISATLTLGEITKAIEIDSSGRRWFGANIKGVWVYPKDNNNQYITLQSSGNTLALKQDKTGHMWIGREASVNTNGAMRCPVENLLVNFEKLYPTNPTPVISSDYLIGNCLLFERKDGLSSNTVRAFALDYQGIVYMATDDGITTVSLTTENFADAKINTLKLEDEAGSAACSKLNDIKDIAFESNGHILWVATNGCGLVRLLVK